MAFPLFYKEELDIHSPLTILDETSSKHIIQVLRMKVGEMIRLTDGKGNLSTALIEDDNRKRCGVRITGNIVVPASERKVTIAISPVKNNSRFEWFLEKATEIGVSKIIPLICDRTEKTAMKHDRMKSILISAMLQSQQSWLPELTEPVSIKEIVQNDHSPAKLIAHCENDQNKNSLPTINFQPSTLILIGPEGDFTTEEISMAINNGFVPVSLGNTRLRTETAGIVAAALLLCG